MNNRASKIPGAGRKTPLCVATVRVSSELTVTARQRRERSARRGVPAEQCGSYATWMLDGQPLCLAHAGRRAIAVLAGEAP